jgi:small subunit ribosomal protein S8
MDPIVDMLNRIRNAQASAKEVVDIPQSRIKYEIAQVLEKYGFVGKIERSGRKGKKLMHVSLIYREGMPAVTGIKRVSRQGQRIYTSYTEMRAIKGGKGISIISTSKGIMSNVEARKQKVGGEVLAEVW